MTEPLASLFISVGIMSVSSLARAAKISGPIARAYWRGEENWEPTIATLRKVADAVDRPMSEILAALCGESRRLRNNCYAPVAQVAQEVGLSEAFFEDACAAGLLGHVDRRSDGEELRILYDRQAIHEATVRLQELREEQERVIHSVNTPAPEHWRQLESTSRETVVGNITFVRILHPPIRASRRLNSRCLFRFEPGSSLVTLGHEGIEFVLPLTGDGLKFELYRLGSDPESIAPTDTYQLANHQALEFAGDRPHRVSSQGFALVYSVSYDPG